MLAYVLWPDRWPAASRAARRAPVERRPRVTTSASTPGDELASWSCVETAPRAGATRSSRSPAAASTGGSSSNGGVRRDDRRQVTLTDDGCSPATARSPAGPVTFEVTNDGERRRSPSSSSRTTDGHHPRRAREHRRRASTARSRSTSSRARYVLSCPNGDADDDGVLVGDRQGARRRRRGADASSRQRRPRGYRAYVEQQTRRAARPDEARSSRRSSAATSRRPRSSSGRPAAHYEAIEPVAESFGDLDPEIDARVNDVAKRRQLDRLPPDRADPLGAGHDRRDDAATPTSCCADVTTLDSAGQDAHVPAGPARERRRRAAERGGELEDHRRGGPLLAHRPLRLRRPTSTGAHEAFVLLRPALVERGDTALADDDRRPVRRGRARRSTRYTPLDAARLRRSTAS